MLFRSSVALVASNLGATSAILAQDVARRDAAFRAAHALADDVDVPPDMLKTMGKPMPQADYFTKIQEQYEKVVLN